MTGLEIVGTWVLVIIILLLIWWCTKKLNLSAFANRQSRYMKTLDRIPISQDKSILLVQIGEKYYLLGAASSAISMLAELDKDEVTQFPINTESLMNNLSFKDFLQKAGGKKKNGG